MFDTFFRTKKKPLKEGKWKEFNKHAVLIAVGEYMHDHKHGKWKEFFDTGELMLEESFQNGVRHGRFATYHRNGNLFSEGSYSWGSREGYFKVFDEDGNHIKSLLFIKNKLIEEVDKRTDKVIAQYGKSED